MHHEIVPQQEIPYRDLPKHSNLPAGSLPEGIHLAAYCCCSAIQQQHIEFVNGNIFYTGPLRRNIHLSDEDFELNLEDYDVDDLED